MAAVWTFLIFSCAILADPMRNAENIILTNGDIQVTGIVPQNGSAQFLGIPYADASRWEDPLIRSLATVDATNVPDGCPQICDSNVNCPKFVSEDCLRLNIWTPFASFENTTELRPVLIYIHGGSFKTGHGYVAEFGDLATSLNCLIVSFNYRLSIFGFFQKDSRLENFGIKDQRTALLWIYENIPSFGGDRDRISILGQSAGALSALIHRAHTQTSSFIKKLILMSPPAVPFASQADSDFTHKALVQSLCRSSFADTSIECLKNQTMMDLLVAEQSNEKKHTKIMTKALPPVVDHSDIVEHPFDVLKNGFYMNGTDVLIGSNSKETYLFLNRLYPDIVSTPAFNIALLALFGSEKASIKEHYADTEGYTGDQKSRLVEITSDSIFTCPIRNALSNIGGNVFTYYFEAHHPGIKDQSYGNFCDGLACHGTDLAYLLEAPFQEDLHGITSSFRTFVSNFLSLGNPSTDNQAWLSDGFMKFGYDGIDLYHVHPLQKTCEFWNEKQDLYTRLDLHSSLPGFTFAEIFGLSFFMGFIFIQIGILVYSWLKYRKVISIQNGIKVFDKRTRSVSVEISSQISEDTFYSILSYPEPLELACENLSVKFNKTVILNDITVSFSPGSLTAIMGPSGCGKTTLLTALKGNLKRSTTGDIYLGYRNIIDISPDEVNSLFGFVSQHNPPFWGLSCRELLIYYAFLLYPKMKEGEIAQKTLDIINLMELKDCCDVVISEPGGTNGGLSGGQLRRISIAIVLLQMPSIICLDEPTSGLDSENALEVIRVLSKLAANGHTVICTIHQPRLEVYQLFDQVLVLTKIGILYHGSPADVDEYLEENFNDMFGRALNPADSMLMLASRYNNGLSTESLNSDESIDLNGIFSVNDPDNTLVDDDESTEHKRTLPTIYEVSESDSSMSVTSSAVDDTLDSHASWSSVAHIDLVIKRSAITETKDSNAPELSDGIKSIREASLIEQKKIGMLEKRVLEIITLNARWWNIRPFSRIIMMLTICIITAIIMGTVHRRHGQDIVSFELQMKGLLLACIGLPAIKNIAISHDFYLNKELYEFDSRNGISSHLGFFMHRVIYETSISSLEALITLGIGAPILDCNTSRLIILVTIFVSYYNAVSTFLTCLFSSRLGGPEARSIAFLIQALFAITSGLWLHSGDSVFFSAIEWLKYMNPQYWAISSLIYQNVHSSGSCEISGDADSCLVTAGDAFESYIRLVDIPSSTAILALVVLWTGIRIVQYFILRSSGLKI